MEYLMYNLDPFEVLNKGYDRAISDRDHWKVEAFRLLEERDKWKDEAERLASLDPEPALAEARAAKQNNKGLRATCEELRTKVKDYYYAQEQDEITIYKLRDSLDAAVADRGKLLSAHATLEAERDNLVQTDTAKSGTIRHLGKLLGEAQANFEDSEDACVKLVATVDHWEAKARIVDARLTRESRYVTILQEDLKEARAAYFLLHKDLCDVKRRD